VRLFKQISLDVEDDCDLIFSSENENESTESTENEDESSSDEIPIVSDINKEIQEMKNELSVEDKSFCKTEDEIVDDANVIEDVDGAKLIEEEEQKSSTNSDASLFLSDLIEEDNESEEHVKKTSQLEKKHFK
jgi:hypothetical protein